MIIAISFIQSHILSEQINKSINSYYQSHPMCSSQLPSYNLCYWGGHLFFFLFNINRVFIPLPSLNSARSASPSTKGNYRLQGSLEKYLCFNTSCMSSRIPPEMTLLLFNGETWSHGRRCFYYNQLQRTGEGELIRSWVRLNFCTFQYLSVSSGNPLQLGCVSKFGFL